MRFLVMNLRYTSMVLEAGLGTSIPSASSYKKEYDSKLHEQKESYERLIAAKEDNISNLKDTVFNLREQQKITNEQIKELTTVTKQAQSLNLIDKSPEQLKLLKGGAKTKTEQSSSEKEEDSSSNETPKTHWWQRFARH